MQHQIEYFLKSMSKSKFFEEIKSAVVERECEAVYNKGINLYFPNTNITHPFACDGFLDTKTESGKLLKLIIEYKFDELLSSKTGRAKVLIQVVFYMKQFELNGLILPNVCMVGDVNECFVIHTNALLKYLDEDVDWSVAPSTAHNVYPDLVLKIANDEEINPFVFNIDENFSFKDVAQKIVDLADNVQRYVHVTEHNIATIYDYFCRNVIKNVKKIKSHDLVGIFMGVITNGDEYYQHPTKKNILVTPLGNIDINGDGFKSFFSYFQRNYTPQEKNNLTAIADRLIEDTDRRNNGDFWTPVLFTDYAHKMISEQLGEDWKEKYVVYDCACGGKNLTRDYKFKELYCSTLFDSELKISERYNKEAISFQFDFLNDGLEKLPKGLLNAFEQNKPIVFFLNPPYATASSGGANSKFKENVGRTKINEQMILDNIGSCSQNLYAQFLYRILLIKQQYNLTSCHIALFSPTLFLTGSSWKGFRNKFLNEFSFIDAVQFKASHFADVSDNWGISFSIWNGGIQNDINNFSYKCIDNFDGEIKIVEAKTVYNTDNLTSANKWVNQDAIKIGVHETITAKSALNISDKLKKVGNNIGYFINDTNNIDANAQGVYFMTMPVSRHIGTIEVQINNFDKCTALFAARRLVSCNWINWADEYIAPNEEHEKYQEFVKDSVIYSLFESKSNQSSLRQVEYKGKLWDIKNEFFWMSKQDIMDLANEYNMDEIYEDAKTSEERYVYKYIQEHKEEFSQEALDVLNKAIELTKKSFKYRQLFADEHPEYQLEKCWDAGFYQLKAIWKEYMKDDFEEFKKLYKVLSDKMRPLVYSIGFLK